MGFNEFVLRPRGFQNAPMEGGGMLNESKGQISWRGSWTDESLTLRHGYRLAFSVLPLRSCVLPV